MIIGVAIPCYDGRVCAATMDSLLGEQLIAHSRGHVMDVARLEGCSSIPSARNVLTYDFLQSRADRLVFIDGDMAWEPGALTDLATCSHDIVGGAYRLKNDSGEFVIRWLPGEAPLWADEEGTLPVAGLGTGFLAISRNALSQIAAAFPGRTYRDQHREPYAYFDMPFADGTMWGEDLRFCEMARAAGIDIRVMPELNLTHIAAPNLGYTGRLGDWLRQRMRAAA
jgi:hypothetical protein